MNREQALKQVWRQTHRDYRGKIDGVKNIMVLRQGGSCLVSVEGLTDAEIKARVKEFIA